MSDRIIAWLRTVVPGAWGALVAWIVTQVALPDELVAYLENPLTVALVVGAVIGLWKVAWQKVAPHIPDWLETILLGHTGTPTYAAPVARVGYNPAAHAEPRAPDA